MNSHDNIQMKVYAISEIIGNKDVGIIVLTNIEGTMHIAVVCDNLIKQELQLRLKKEKKCSRMLPEVMFNIINQRFGCDYEIIIDEIADGEYYAIVIDKYYEQSYKLRATDAILLHLISRMPLYATSKIVKEQAMPVAPGNVAMSLPYNALSDNMLLDAMKSAIDMEKYEMASTIRDELKKRGKIK